MKTGISYFGNRNPEHFRRDAEVMMRNHCTYVVHTFSETDLAFYAGTMKEIVAISHEAGLEVWVDPWGVGQVFGGETFSRLIATHLDHRQVSAKGQSLAIACINNPDFRRFMTHWTDTAIELGADVLFWDEPHFHIFEKGDDDWACHCIHCEIAFKAASGRDLPLELTPEVRKFRDHSIVTFLTELCDRVKARGKRNAVCLLPPYIVPDCLADWDTVARIKSLDIIGTDPYWHLGGIKAQEIVREYSRKIADLARLYNKEAQIWILAFRIKQGTESDLARACEAAYKEGIRNLAAWSYLGTGYMSHLASDNPQLVWETLGRAYQKLRNL
ncbi:MAG: hypothetical protein HYY14_02015 [Candidatus Omnitrophica bacterium]|nr:hypothetical protein [Candidatus Omnitrophota bacterium]